MSMPFRKLTDELLLQSLSKNSDGSEAAFSELYKRYREPLLTKAVNFLGCENTAKDCLQDVFVSIWVKRETLEIHNLKSYLHQAVRFRALKCISHKKSFSGLDDHMEYSSDFSDPVA